LFFFLGTTSFRLLKPVACPITPCLIESRDVSSGGYLREQNSMAGDGVRHTSYHDNGRKSRMLCAARLLSAFDSRYPLNGNYETALSCYELLIETLESPAAAREMSAFVHMPANEIQASAETIIDHLLFNHENNPYVTLGVQRHAPPAEVTRRWKRLITLYHPDKYPNQKKYEERAKKINQAYAEIRQMTEGDARYEIMRKVKRYHPHGSSRIYYSQRMRRLPAVIIAAAIIMAIISMLLFVSRIVKEYYAPRPGREVKISMSAVMGSVSLIYDLRTGVVAPMRRSYTTVSPVDRSNPCNTRRHQARTL
jgi:hypothetical protein